jgi:hypothetical protein
MSITKLHVGETAEILEKIRPGIEQASSLQDALQVLTTTLMGDYADSVALVRAFVTVSFDTLPAPKKEFVQNIVKNAANLDTIPDDTPVLSLLATSGQEPDWNDVDKSERHTGIPLMSDEFVAEIPMVSRLLTDLGIAADLGVDEGSTYSDDPRSSVRAFYVGDALTDADARGRKVIVNQEFVEQYGIKTVFGGGGAYPNFSKNVLAIIFFTKEHVESDVATAFEPFIASVQAITEKFLANDRIF